MNRFTSMGLLTAVAIVALLPGVAAGGALVPDDPVQYRSDPVQTPSDPGGAHGAPAPIIGAGLPIIVLVGGGYYLVRRLRRKG